MGMKIDRYVNRFLSRWFPEDAQGNRTVYLHSQNLNEDRRGEVKGWPWHGRLWFHMGPRRTLAFSWNLWTHFCGISVGTDYEDRGLKLHFAIPPVSFWLTIPVWQKFLAKKEYRKLEFEFFEFRVFDWTLWWKFFEGADWDSRTPKWKNGNFHFLDFVLGKTKYEEGKGKIHNVVIPMPEGPYEATIQITEDSWKRPRGFKQVIRRARVDVPQGIPHEGKGESDYNCGEDRSFGFTGPADSVEDAIGKMVAGVLRDRRRYNGNILAVYPHPKDQVKPPPPENNGPGGDSQAESAA